MPALADPVAERCFACGGCFIAAAGMTHAYMLSSPGCWAAYGELLTREYESPALFGAAHRMTVDAYALQHPGDPGDRRAVQSVWVHYVGLHLLLESGRPAALIAPIMQRLAGRAFAALPPAPHDFGVTHADVLTHPVSGHVSAVRAWATCAYGAWSGLREPAVALLATL